MPEHAAQLGATPVIAALAALGAALTWAVGSILFARLLRARADGPLPQAAVGGTLPATTAAALNLFKNSLAGAIFVAIVATCGGVFPAHGVWPALIASGFFGFAIGDTLFFAALPRAGVQATAMIGQLNVPVAALLSFLFLGEELNLATLVSIAVVLAGVALVVSEAPREAVASRSRRRAGIAFAVGAAVTQAVGVVLGHQAMEGGELLPGTLVRLVGGIGGAFLLAALLGLRSTPRASTARAELVQLVRPFAQPGLWSRLIPAALFGSVIGLPLFHLGLRDLPGGVASVLFATTPLFTLPLAALSGERHSARAIIGTWIGFAGVAGVVFSLETRA